MRWHKVSLLALTFHPLGCWPSLLLRTNCGWWHSKKLVAYPHSFPGGGGAGGEQQPSFLVWVYLSITAIKEHRADSSPADFLQCGTQTLMMDIYGTLHPKLQRKHSFKCTCNMVYHMLSYSGQGPLLWRSQIQAQCLLHSVRIHTKLPIGHTQNIPRGFILVVTWLD